MVLPAFDEAVEKEDLENNLGKEKRSAGIDFDKVGEREGEAKARALANLIFSLFVSTKAEWETDQGEGRIVPVVFAKFYRKWLEFGEILKDNVYSY